MFESRGNLNGSAVEALKTFCSVVNPTGKAFHPTFLLATIERNEKKRGGYAKFFHSSSAMNFMVKGSYTKAFDKHLNENPLGPHPREITFRDFPKRLCFTLQYASVRGTTSRLTIFYRKMREICKPQLVVFGNNRYEVRRRAQLAGLPEPTWIPPLWTYAPTQQAPQLSELQVLAQIRVPLGDLLDFLARYQ